MHRSTRAHNVFNLKFYASRKNKLLIEFGSYQNLLHTQYNNDFIINVSNRSFRFHWYQFYFNVPSNKRTTTYWTQESKNVAILR